MHKASALEDPVSKTYSLVINNEMKFTKLRLSMRNVGRGIHLRQHSTNVILKCNHEWTIYKLYSNCWEPSNDNDEKFYPVRENCDLRRSHQKLIECQECSTIHPSFHASQTAKKLKNLQNSFLNHEAILASTCCIQCQEFLTLETAKI